jgi:hypothetical protein
MPRTPFALLLLTAALIAPAAGCKRPGSPQLQGKWKGTKAEGVDANAQSNANAFATGMELEVKGDVITVTFAPNQRQSGRYQVKSQNKTTVVITTDKDGPNTEETFTFVDDKTMRWAVFDGKAITFAKQ